MHELTHLFNTIDWHYVIVHQKAILALIGGSAGLWVVVQTFLVKLHINGPKLSFAISHLFALLTAVSTYALSSASPNIAITYSWVWVLLQTWHHFVLNPNYNKYVLPFLTWLNGVKIPAANSVDTPTDTFV